MTITFHAEVRDYTQGVGEISIPAASSVRALMDMLGEHFGEQLRQFLFGDDTCFFLVNGKGIMATGGLNTPLADGDTVEVLPFIDAG